MSTGGYTAIPVMGNNNNKGEIQFGLLTGGYWDCRGAAAGMGACHPPVPPLTGAVHSGYRQPCY